MTDVVHPVVPLELPETWVRLPVARDGDRPGQRALLADWCGEPPADLVRQLVRLSRQASEDGVAFAAVLLATVGLGGGGPDHRVPISGALTVGFRRAPGPPRVVAEGVLAVLRQGGGPTRRAELVGLAGDPDRPAALVQERGVQDGRLLARSEVLWPIADRLAGVCVTTADLPLADAMREVALSVAVGLSVQRVAPVNA